MLQTVNLNTRNNHKLLHVWHLGTTLPPDVGTAASN